MSQRKLLKIKHELDFLSIKIHLSGFDISDLNLQLQQLRNDLLASKLDMKRDTEKPFDSEVDQHQRGNQVNFDLPPKFDEYEDKQEEVEEKEKEDREEKDDDTFEEILVEEEEKEEVHEAYEEESYKNEGQEVDFDLPPKFDEYEPDNGEVLVIESTWNELTKEVVETDEGAKLTFATPHPPKDREDHSLLFISFGEPPILSPTPSPPPTLKHKFCQTPTCLIQTSKGKGKQRVSKIKRDLFAWLILFQPELK